MAQSRIWMRKGIKSRVFTETFWAKYSRRYKFAFKANTQDVKLTEADRHNR